jgi:hypothetical protein
MNVEVQEIPSLMRDSLSALINPGGATQHEHNIADRKLEQYENALSITASESAIYQQRVDAVVQAAEQQVSLALPKQLSPEARASLSIDELKQYNNDLSNALELITKLSSIINGQSIAEPVSRATAEGVFVEYKDRRPGVDPHKAYAFRVEPSKGTVMEELRQLLGEDEARQLAKDWGNRCSLNQKLEVAMDVAIFLDSNNKSREVQGEDFNATGTNFSDDLALTLLSARVLRKERDNQDLSEAEKDLLNKLKVGVIRSCSGALDIGGRGRLRAGSFDGDSRPDYWASCSSPSRN